MVEQQPDIMRAVSCRSVYSRKADFSDLMSARTVSKLEVERTCRRSGGLASDSRVAHLGPSYPLPLICFVSFLSLLVGLIVAGAHGAIMYAGCPLGLNGCNSFHGKEDKGFFLLRAVDKLTDGAVPEDVVYVVVGALGAAFFALLAAHLPEHLAFQVRGGGGVQSLVSVATGRPITLAAAGLRLLGTSVYLGTGGTLGMDGPAIQMCTAVPTFVGDLLGLRSLPTQSLLATLGFAGAFAATFNAPLAGILFAVEELHHVSSRLSAHVVVIIVISSIVATVVARALIWGQALLDANWSESIFESIRGGSLNQVLGRHMWMLISVPIAVLCSIVGFGLHWCLYQFHALTQYLQRRSVPFGLLFVLHAVAAGLVGSAVFRTTGLRGVWGIGYESLQQSFSHEFKTFEYMIFALGKALATALAVSVRSPGDLLEPVLIVGAFLGGSVGSLLQDLVVDNELEEEFLRPCLLFGMVGFFASCFRFPLTPFVIAIEVLGVDTYKLVLPAAISCVTAITVSNRLFPPLLDQIMHEDGIDLEALSAEADADDAAIHRYEEETGCASDKRVHCDSPSEPSLSMSAVESGRSIPRISLLSSGSSAGVVHSVIASIAFSLQALTHNLDTPQRAASRAMSMSTATFSQQPIGASQGLPRLLAASRSKEAAELSTKVYSSGTSPANETSQQLQPQPRLGRHQAIVAESVVVNTPSASSSQQGASTNLSDQDRRVQQSPAVPAPTPQCHGMDADAAAGAARVIVDGEEETWI